MPKSIPACCRIFTAVLATCARDRRQRNSGNPAWKTYSAFSFDRSLILSSIRPVAAFLGGLLQHVELGAKALDHRRQLRQGVAFLDQGCAQFAHCLQRLHVVAADFATDIALAAQVAHEDRLLHLLGNCRAAVHQRKRRYQPSARRVGVEFASLHAWASLGEPRALDQVERNPFAICAPSASHCVCAIIFQCHFVLSLSSFAKSTAFRD